MMKKTMFITSLLAVGLAATSIDFNLASPNPKHVAPSSASEVLSFSSSVKDAVKSIVNISAKKHQQISQNSNPIFNDPFFKNFFGANRGGTVPRDRAQRALGSGVILSSDGYIITNNHVVENADEIVITLPNSTKEYNAKLVGTDKDSDLAVIKIDAEKLPAIKLGHASSLEVGDIVFAIGNPFGVGETVTQGIISALNKNRVGINQYENFIQTDASINPGNSGGALVDSRGALIGINSAILTRSGGNNGVGFAIPIDMVKNITKKLVEDGKVTRGYLGVSIADLSEDFKSVYNHKNGAILLSVEQDGAGDKYGLKRGDLIYALESKKVKDASHLKQQIASFKPDSKINMSVERDKKNLDISVVLGSRDNLASALSDHKLLSGLHLGELSAEKLYKYRLPKGLQGALIEDVEPASRAEKVGFQSGDVIIGVESYDINNLVQLDGVLKKYKKRAKRFYVNRYGVILMFVMK